MSVKGYKSSKQLEIIIMNYNKRLSEYDKDIQIDIMFVKKTTSKKNPYKTWMFEARNNDITKMILDTLDYMNSVVCSRSITEYDLELSVDDTVQVVDETKVLNSKQIKESITIVMDDTNTVNDKMDYNIFDFIVVQLSDNREKNPLSQLTLFKKHLKSPAKYSRAMSFTLNGSKTAKLFNKRLLVISSEIDAFCNDGYYYVFNRNSFNSMLIFKDFYNKIVDDNMKNITDSGLFDKPEEFIDECKNNGRYITKLTKAILADGFKNVKTHKDKLEELKKNYGLDIKLTNEGKIVYEKSTVDEVLNILLDHYVTSALTSRKMLALAIEKYK